MLLSCGRCESPNTTLTEGPHGPHGDKLTCDDCGAFKWLPKRPEQRRVAIKSKTRRLVAQRALGRCELCGDRGALGHVSHIVSLDAVERFGVPDEMADLDWNGEWNLMWLCESCNLDMGREPMDLRMAMAIVYARKRWEESNGRV